MNKTDELAKEINHILLNETLIVSYKKNEEALQISNLFHLEEEIKKLQKKIVQAKYKDGCNLIQLEKDYKVLKNTFFENPIVVNYLNDKEEVNNLLQSMIELIQNELILE